MSESPRVERPSVLFENELLTNEVRRLRDLLSEANGQNERIRAKLKRVSQGSPVPSVGGGATGVPVTVMTDEERRVRELETQALDDMHWLVNRLDKLRVVGPILRTYKGFKTLKARYGDDPRART